MTGDFCRCFSQLLNEITPHFQAWRTLDPAAATAARYRLAPLTANPYAAAAGQVRRPAAESRRAFPQLNAMMVSGSLSSVMETLDHWQRNDPMDEHPALECAGRVRRPRGAGQSHPLDPCRDCSQITEDRQSDIVDLVGFLFD
jgi:hypothetical protein